MINFSKLVDTINEATNIANSSLLQSQNDIMSTYFEKNGTSENYQAKVVTINYPVKAEDNTVQIVAVNVPLITLVPISTSRIEELKFTTNLEVTLNDSNNLLVSFSNENENDNNLFNRKKSSSATYAKIEITLKPNESPEGLKNIIEGYEKILRTQIPG